MSITNLHAACDVVPERGRFTEVVGLTDTHLLKYCVTEVGDHWVLAWRFGEPKVTGYDVSETVASSLFARAHLTEEQMADQVRDAKWFVPAAVLTTGLRPKKAHE